VAERLLGTGVELRLVRDESHWLDLVRREDRLEARRLEALLASGRVVLVETQVFVDLEDDGRGFSDGGNGERAAGGGLVGGFPRGAALPSPAAPATSTSI
jgi:hypothetical protein